MDWPDWCDAGKFVSVTTMSETFVGRLIVDDFFFNGTDEVPVFMVVVTAGDIRSFADAERWCFIDKED